MKRAKFSNFFKIFSSLIVIGGLISQASFGNSLGGAPRRIVTLAPSLGEIAADVLGEQLEFIVGVSDYTDYPPALKSKKSIGSYARFNVEQVVALKPDLVLATRDGNLKDQILQLKEHELNVLVVQSETLPDVSHSMKVIGEALGYKDRGLTLAEALERGLKRLERPVQSGPKVFFQLGASPLVSVGGRSYLNDVARRLGATNIFGELEAGYPRPSLEEVLKRNPDVIVVLSLGENRAEFEKMAADWKRFPMVSAVKSNRVVILKSDELLRPTARLLEGAAALKKVLWP